MTPEQFVSKWMHAILDPVLWQSTKELKADMQADLASVLAGEREAVINEMPKVVFHIFKRFWNETDRAAESFFCLWKHDDKLAAIRRGA